MTTTRVAWGVVVWKMKSGTRPKGDTHTHSQAEQSRKNKKKKCIIISRKHTSRRGSNFSSFLTNGARRHRHSLHCWTITIVIKNTIDEARRSCRTNKPPSPPSSLMWKKFPNGRPVSGVKSRCITNQRAPVLLCSAPASAHGTRPLRLEKGSHPPPPLVPSFLHVCSTVLSLSPSALC